MLKPFDARVVVKKPAREEQTASGIILPDTVNEQGQTAQGVVISVGRGSRNMSTGEWMPIPLKEGDRTILSACCVSTQDWCLCSASIKFNQERLR